MFVITLKDDSFIFANKYDAKVIFPFIFIKESKRHNKGLIIHERTHIKQVFLLKGLLYYFSKEMKYRLELEAYQNQLIYNVNQYKEEEREVQYIRLAKVYSDKIATLYGLPDGTYNRAYDDFMANMDKIRD